MFNWYYCTEGNCLDARWHGCNEIYKATNRSCETIRRVKNKSESLDQDEGSQLKQKILVSDFGDVLVSVVSLM